MSVDRIGISYSEGDSMEEIAEDFYLTADQVAPALEYYLANRATIDEDIRRSDEELERIAATWHAAGPPK